jgi:hypothetical protein
MLWSARRSDPNRRRINPDSEIGTADSTDFADFEEVIGMTVRTFSCTRERKKSPLQQSRRYFQR